MKKIFTSAFFVCLKKAVPGIAVAVWLLLCTPAFATHIMGSDITYKLVGTKKYEVTLTVYRDCNGNSLSTSQYLDVDCNTSSWNNSYYLSYKGNKDITGLNSSCSAKSKCAGGTFGYGLQEHTFQVTIDLSSVSCSSFTLSWFQSARNSTISTGAANQNFYTFATLRTDVVNNSPVFTSPAAALICSGADFVFNNGALDTTDGDSLSYALVAPLRAAGTPTSFSGSWSATKPLTFLGFPNANLPLPSGFHLDSITGDLAFRPTVTNQVSIIVLEVTEWRNISGTMTIVGKTRRDIQVIVINCNGNDPPAVLGSSTATCPGEQACINITTLDTNSSDSVRVTWNGGISGATFTSSNGTLKWDTARICWTPTQADVSTIPYTFTITAKDNGCPFSTQTVKGFTIFVYEPPAATSHVLSLGCGHVNVDYTPNKFYNDLTQKWIARDTLGKIVSTSTKKADTLLLPKGKVYITLELKALGNCITAYHDTLLIPEHVEVHLPADTFACQGVQIPVNGTTVDGIAPYHYYWNTAAGDTLTSLTLDTSKGAKYWLTVTDGVGCKWWDTINVCWDTVPKTQFITGPTCLNNTVQFTNTTLAYPKDSIYYTWGLGDTGTSTLKNPVYTYAQEDTFTISLKAITDKGCKDSTTGGIIIHPLPTAGFAINDTGQCLNTNNYVFTNQSTISTGTLSSLWRFGDGDTSIMQNASHKFVKDSAFAVRLTVTSDKLCRDSASKLVDVFTVPQSKFIVNDSSQCVNANTFGFTNTATIKNGTLSYLWHFGNGDTTTVKSPSYTYTVHDTFDVQMISVSDKDCRDTATRKMIVFPKPQVAFTVNDTDQCYTGNSFIFTNGSSIPYGSLSYIWYAGDGTFGFTTNYQKSYSADTIYRVKLRAASSHGCIDTLVKEVAVRPQPVMNFTINKTGQCVNNNLFAFTNKTTIKYGSQQFLWDFANGTNSTATDTLIVYTADQDYHVLLRSTTNYGCTDTIGKNITVYTKPNPAYTVNDSTQCVNTDIFNFINLSTIKPGNGGIAYRWFFGTGDSTTIDNPTYGYAKDSTYVVKLKTISMHGCIDSVSHTMVVFPKPKADFAINDTDQCLNINQYFYTNASTLKYGTLSYQWDLGNGIQSNAKDPGMVYSKDTGYKVTLIPRSDEFCYDTLSKNIVVYPVPKVDFAVNDSDQCFNTNNYTFTNKTTIKYGTITHEWDLGGEAATVVASPAFVFSNDTSYSIKLKVTSDQQCTDSLYRQVTVHPVPQVAFSINDTDQCVNTDLFKFTNGSGIKYGTLQYRWYYGSGDSSAIASPNYGYVNDGTYRVTLKATSDYNCIDSAHKYVWAIPKPNARFAIDDSSQCVNPGVFGFTNQSVIKYLTPLYYNWDFDNGATTTQKDTAVAYTINGEYHARLIVRSAENCYDTFTRIVLVYPRPYSGFTIAVDSQCVTGNAFAFANTTTIDSGTLNHTWFYGDGNSAAGTNPGHSYAADGGYSVKLKTVSGFGCVDSIEHPVVVMPKPNVQFTVNDSGQCVNDNLFTFTNTTTLKHGILAYNWDFANGITAVAKDTSVNYTYDSLYRAVLRATSDFGCTDTFGRYVVVHSKPNPGYTVDDSAQCLDSNKFTFTNTGTIKTGSFTSQWTFDDGQAFTTPNVNTKFNNPNTYNLKLLLTSNFNCKDSVSGQVIVYPHPNPDFAGLSKYYCTDYPVFNLTPVVAGGTFGGKNIAGNSYVPTQLGLDTVTYTVQVNGCFSDTAKYTIVHPLPVLALGADTTLCRREPIFFNVAFPNSTYLWSDGSTLPDFRVMQPGRYKITLFNLCDTLTDEINIFYRNEDCNYYFPTAFTPNGDGRNDVFIPYLENAMELRMWVYDRWGGLVFESHELNNGWDGKLPDGEYAPVGVYVWHIEAKFNNLGFIYSHADNGTVTVVR